MQKFNLVVIKSIKGKKGEEVFRISKLAETINDAVRQVREMCDPSWVVLQASQFKKEEPEEIVAEAA